MMEGGSTDTYGTTNERESSKLMTTAMAGAALDAAKIEAVKMKNMLLHLRDGPLSIKILCYIAGGLLVVTSFFNFFGSFFTLHPIDAVVNLYMLVFGVTIVLIESRSFLLPKWLLENIHTYCAFFTVVWGRGAFLVFVGTLVLAKWRFVDIVVGIYLVGVGAGMIYWGEEAYKNLHALVAEMKDPEVVRATFSKFDHNEDGVLDAKELGQLLQSLGANLRPTEVEAAVIIMDKDHDGKISLDEFQAWWGRYQGPDMV